VPERREVTDETASTATLVQEPAPPQEAVAERPPRRRRLRALRVSPLAPVLGWLTAWGAAALATACLLEAGVDLGLGLGIATGDPGVEDRFLPGLWVLIVQAGAFVLGGYAAGRLARSLALLHAGLAWVVAMLATGADAVVIALRDGGDSVLERLGCPTGRTRGSGGPGRRPSRWAPSRWPASPGRSSGASSRRPPTAPLRAPVPRPTPPTANLGHRRAAGPREPRVAAW
jgi:hypothetical protein